MECLENKIPHLAKQYTVGLIVIDSIAAPIRSEFEMNDTKERTLAIHKVGRTLNMVARMLKAPVVILNQVNHLYFAKLGEYKAFIFYRFIFNIVTITFYLYNSRLRQL